MTIWAVLAATAAAFVLGGAYNTVFGKRLAALSEAAAAGDQPPWKLAIELGRCLLMAAVVAGLAARGDIDTWAGGLLLGLVLWIGFPFVLWTGAVVWENVPRALAAIHAGDWLAKLLAVAVIVSVWQ